MKTDEHVWICFSNRCFACTGFSRKDEKALADDITQRGGKYQNYISNKTNYLIVNTNSTLETSSKYQKALELRTRAPIHIVSYSDYLKYRNITYLNGREDDYGCQMIDLIKVFNAFSGGYSVKAVTWHDDTFGWLGDYDVLISISNEQNALDIYLYGDDRAGVDIGDYSAEHSQRDYIEKQDRYLTIEEAINLARQFINNHICSVACFEGETPVCSDPVQLVDASIVLNPTREKLAELIFEDSTQPISPQKKFRVRFWNKEHDLSI